MHRDPEEHKRTRFADIGVGEFVHDTDLLWGSAGWECIAHGIPYMETLNLDSNRFKELYGFPSRPRISHVEGIADVMSLIESVYLDLACIRSAFRENVIWHKQFIQTVTIDRWLNLFHQTMANKGFYS